LKRLVVSGPLAVVDNVLTLSIERLHLLLPNLHCQSYK
jgi:hypothetical protein